MEKTNYQFTQVPTNLFILLDNNCRSMLFTLIQLSSYYADEDGWFFRTYTDLEAESNLSQNLVKATVQTLFNHHIIEAKPTGQSKGKKPNYYKVNFDEFAKYDEISIEDAMKNPDLKIYTVNYKGSCFKLNLVRDTVENTVTKTVNKPVKSDNNIDNIENAYNIENVKNVYNTECIHEDISKECNTLEKSEDFEIACSEQTESSTVEDEVCDWDIELEVLEEQIKTASSVNTIIQLSKKFKKLQDTNDFPTEFEERLKHINSIAATRVYTLKTKSCYT